MREYDPVALERAANTGDYDRVEAALGIRLSLESVRAIKRALQDTLARDVTLGTVLALIDRASRDPLGFAWERRELRRRHLQLLAVFWQDGQSHQLSVGIAATTGKTLGTAWPALRGWKPSLEANRELAIAWAKDLEQPSRLALKVTRRVAAPVSAADDGAEDALLAAIVAAPRDDAPRLVYADWLLERGDSRGEFIRLQIDHFRTPSDAKWARINRMLKASFSELAGELAPHTTAGQMRRGFPTTVTLTPAVFLKQGERFFSRWPVESVWLEAPNLNSKHLAQIASSAAMRLVRHLVISGPRLELAGLAKGTRFESLHTLELDGDTTATDWSALFTRLKAPALEAVIVRSSPHPAIFEAFARATGLPRMRVFRDFISPGRSRITAAQWKAGLTALASCATFEGLELHQCQQLGDDAWSVLFAKQAKARWKDLSLDAPRATDALIAAMGASPRAESLESIRLFGGQFTVDGVLQLLSLPRLHTLAIRDVTWTAEDSRRLLSAMEALPRAHPLRSVAVPGGPARHPRFENAS